MESVTKVLGAVHEGKVVVSSLPFADGEAVEMVATLLDNGLRDSTQLGATQKEEP